MSSRYYFANDLETKTDESPEELLKDLNLKVDQSIKHQVLSEPKRIVQFMSPEIVEAERMVANLEFLKSRLPDYIESLNNRLNKSIEHYQSIIDKKKS